MHQIRKTKVAIKGGPGGVGIYFDKNDSQVKTHDGSVTRSLEVKVAGLTAKTADYTVVLPADNGKIFEANGAATVTFTLPAVSSANKGMRITVVVKTLPTGVGTSLSPNAADRIIYKADDADLVNTAATDVLGDLVTVESDGVDGWIVVAKIGIWA